MGLKTKKWWVTVNNHLPLGSYPCPPIKLCSPAIKIMFYVYIIVDEFRK